MTQNTYIIVTDVTCDLPADYTSQNNITNLNMVYTIDGINYTEGTSDSLTPVQFYNKLREGSTAKTSQITPEIYEKQFKALLDKGYDILYIGFSSGLSGSFQSACIAKSEIENIYPSRKILLIDSLCASLGQGYLVNYAVELKNQGKNIQDVYDATLSNALHVCQYFTVDDLNHLYRGGRVSKITAMVGTLLGIKPVMHVNNDGKLVAYGKVRGRKASLDSLINKIAEKAAVSSSEYVFISHGDCLADAKYVATAIENKFKLKTKLINTIGPVIGSHSGPGTVALFFFGTNRTEKVL